MMRQGEAHAGRHEWVSLIAADGLLNVPSFAAGCVCNYPIQTAFAMVHMPELAVGENPEQPRAKAAPQPHE